MPACGVHEYECSSAVMPCEAASRTSNEMLYWKPDAVIVQCAACDLDVR